MIVPEANYVSVKPLLPIIIDTNLPSFGIHIEPKGTKTNFQMIAMYVTDVVILIGWEEFFLNTSQKYPKLVKVITWSKDKYNRISLSVVVYGGGDDAKYITNDLTSVT